MPSGYYEFSTLMPGTYRLVEVTQPARYRDGLDTAGTVDGKASGQAQNPGDTIDAIFLAGGSIGQDYDFGEYLPVSVQGHVHLASADGDCFSQDVQHRPVADAVIRLEDPQGRLVAETKTDAQGNYEFQNLSPGVYSVVEITPAGLIDGGARAGQVDGQTRGTIVDANHISQIQLVSGEQGEDYDFCEFEPVTLSGVVYHDRNNNGVRESGESLLSDVEIRLLGPEGETVATTRTGALGEYEFVGAYAGTYTLLETQPAGWRDGQDRAGTVGGVTVGQAVNPGDRIQQITLRWGDHGIDYDFGELLPVQISGKVCLSTTSGDCDTPGVSHRPLPDVVVELLDEAGQRLQQTVTDADGRYMFSDLPPGRYSVRETTPAGLIDAQAEAGSIDGRPAGIVRDANNVTDIVLLSGQQARDVDFCEHAPSVLSGYVYHDANDDGRRTSSEQPIGDVEIRLLDRSGQTIATTRTSAAGFYEFQNLHAGTYHLREVQPADWMDGQDAAGSVDGQPSGRAVNPGDAIDQIELGWGQSGVEYDFGELREARIAGLVHVDLNNDGNLQSNERVLPGVRIELLDAGGRVVATTHTDRDGQFRFDGLRPGVYTLRETQPSGFFSGRQRAGTGGGLADVENLIREIPIHSGDQLVDYVFCEEPPAEVSGYVFQDGPIIVLQLGETLPDDLSTLRDGQFTADDQPLAGVVLELRHGIFGTQIMGESALPGVYPDGPITIVTDAQGFYRFTGLRKGNYAIYENQPAGFLDGIDTHGTVPAIAINRHQEIQPELLDSLQKDPNFDAIIRIVLPPGQVSAQNNFSEVAVNSRPRIPVELPPSPPITPRPPIETELPPARQPTLLEMLQSPIKPFGHMLGMWGKSWHLSVIDGGQPRDAGGPLVAQAPVRPESVLTLPVSWRSESLDELVWTIHAGTTQPRTARFGMAGGIPFAGDFNGDGLAEIGIFWQGQWFIDLNGNGLWDDEDLWAKLGNNADLPITGDWDGDGKDDIGIYGPIWPGDPRDRARAGAAGSTERTTGRGEERSARAVRSTGWSTYVAARRSRTAAERPDRPCVLLRCHGLPTRRRRLERRRHQHDRCLPSGRVATGSRR